MGYGEISFLGAKDGEFKSTESQFAGASREAAPPKTEDSGEGLSAGPREKLARLNAKRDERLKKPLGRSGGPQTEEGKTRASQNSLKHGAYAEPFRWVDEEFYELDREVQNRFHPMGRFESSLLRSVAHAMFCTSQVDRYQRRQLNAADNREPSPDQLACELEFPFHPEYSDLLVGSHDERALWRKVEAFVRLECGPPELLSGSVMSPQDRRAANLYETACRKLSTQPAQHLEKEFFAELDQVMHDAGRGAGYVGAKLIRVGDVTPLVDYWLYRNVLRISAAKEHLKNQACLDVLTDEKIARARRHSIASSRDLLDAFHEARSNRPRHS